MRAYVALLLLLAGCAPAPGFHALESPGSTTAAMPRLTATPTGDALLSWLETADAVDTLRFARVGPEGAGIPRTIATGTDWFVNWADFPSTVELEDGTLVAHWLQEEGEDTYAYGVRLVFSTDAGATWSPPVVPHDDGTQTEHGFVSLVPRGDHVLVVWLDGRTYAPTVTATGDTLAPAREMQLRAAQFDRGGTKLEEWVLDRRVCDCCQTAALATGDGVLVAYRDRTGGEIRDISAVTGPPWSPPGPVADQGWEIAGCPVNGPTLAGTGDEVVAAWYSAADATGAVWTAWSEDAGSTWSTPQRVDGGDPLGRVDVGWLGPGRGVVSWMEPDPEGEARILVRELRRDGPAGEVVEVGNASSARSSGFPQLEVTREGILMAWTTPDAGIALGRVELP